MAFDLKQMSWTYDAHSWERNISMWNIFHNSAGSKNDFAAHDIRRLGFCARQLIRLNNKWPTHLKLSEVNGLEEFIKNFPDDCIIE